MLPKFSRCSTLFLVAFILEVQRTTAAPENTSEVEKSRKLSEFTDDEKVKKWKASLSCFNYTTKLNLEELSGIFYVPSLYAPPYWSTFGPQLCKWIHIIPESANRVQYFGGYFSTIQAKLYNYTANVKYNREDKVYNIEEHLFATGKTYSFSATPCSVSRHTFMFYLPHLTKENECKSQTFVFSRNSKTMAKDKKKLESKCFDKYFHIPVHERPYATTGCQDVGLF